MNLVLCGLLVAAYFALLGLGCWITEKLTREDTNDDAS